MYIGSELHKERFCRQFIDSHGDFDPERLPWPELDDASLERMRAIPFWEEVLHTERRAGRIVAAFAGTISDPLVRAAIELQGFEEERHARFLEAMIRRYGLAAEEKEVEPIGPSLYKAFVDFGYGECLDSFLGFGVFKIARQSGFLPDRLFEIFDMLMLEETRHIVFFVNWMAWQQAMRGRGAPWLRAVASAHYYARAIGRLLATIHRGRSAKDGTDFSATQASVFLNGFTFRRLLEACYAENKRRMANVEPNLLRPRLLSDLAGAALITMGFLPNIPVRSSHTLRR